jgi:hypothetical protein
MQEQYVMRMFEEHLEASAQLAFTQTGTVGRSCTELTVLFKPVTSESPQVKWTCFAVERSETLSYVFRLLVHCLDPILPR